MTCAARSVALQRAIGEATVLFNRRARAFPVVAMGQVGGARGSVSRALRHRRPNPEMSSGGGGALRLALAP